MTVKELKAQLEKLDENAPICFDVWYRKPGDWKSERVSLYDIHVSKTLMGPVITTDIQNPVEELDFKDWGK